ncbi:MAG: polyprenyl synthetase family protein [Bacteroidales bacterium]|nr:polyprenyl synthetase family protein [Bacteroidales bacterium]
MKQNIEELFAKVLEKREPANLYQPILYTLSQGGKRLRPRLVLMATEAFGGDIEKAVYPAAAFDMLHNFTLIHDDIMDDAPIRRGKPTVYKQWNGNIAILSGDALANMALIEMLDTPISAENVVKLTKLFAQTSVEICEGQQYDLDFETCDHVSIEDYLYMIRFKTAVLLAACLKAGAMISDAPKEAQEAIYQFGISIGLAFQLKDDLLDVYGDKAVFGKKIGGDIRENKKTYLYLRALEEADESSRKELLRLFSSTDFDEEEKFQAVSSIFNKLKIKEKTENKIEELLQQAFIELDKIQISDSKKNIFKDLAVELSRRIK